MKSLFAAILKDIRQTPRLAVKVSHSAGMHPHILSKLVTGRVSDPKMKTVIKIAQGYYDVKKEGDRFVGSKRAEGALFFTEQYPALMRDLIESDEKLRWAVVHESGLQHGTMYRLMDDPHCIRLSSAERICRALWTVKDRDAATASAKRPVGRFAR